MVEKLKTPKSINWDDTPEAMLERHYIISDVYEKINELIEVVNGILDYAPLEMAMKAEPELAKNVQDKFAEQRKWIGKLCKFWDDDAFITSKDWAYGILTSIDKGMQYQYCCNEISNFKHCELVKPDDDIILKE